MDQNGCSKASAITKAGNTVQIHYEIKILSVLHIYCKDSWGNTDVSETKNSHELCFLLLNVALILDLRDSLLATYLMLNPLEINKGIHKESSLQTVPWTRNLLPPSTFWTIPKNILSLSPFLNPTDITQCSKPMKNSHYRNNDFNPNKTKPRHITTPFNSIEINNIIRGEQNFKFPFFLILLYGFKTTTTTVIILIIPSSNSRIPSF